MTLYEIAEHLGISHQRVAEILANAIRKFRLGLEQRGIKLEDLL